MERNICFRDHEFANKKININGKKLIKLINQILPLLKNPINAPTDIDIKGITITFRYRTEVIVRSSGSPYFFLICSNLRLFVCEYSSINLPIVVVFNRIKLPKLSSIKLITTAKIIINIFRVMICYSSFKIRNHPPCGQAAHLAPYFSFCWQFGFLA